MNHGLLDVPAPLYGAFDRALTVILPPPARLVVWGVLGALVSVLLYRALSPQRRIAAAKARLLALRRQLDAHDGTFEQALPLLRAHIGASLRHVWLVLPATVLASLPVLTLLIWLAGTYGHRLPEPGQGPPVKVAPAGLDVRWQDRPPQVTVLDKGRTVAQVPLTAPVTRVEKRRWWNALVANPIGYLPSDGPVRRVHIALEPRRYLDFGPDWLRGWAALFMSVLFAASLLTQRLARVE